MQIRTIIAAILTLIASACADPNAKPSDVYAHEKISGYKPENVCDKNTMRLDYAALLALRHDPSVINTGTTITRIDHESWSDLSANSDGSVSCEIDMAMLLTNGATVGGLVRVTYADQNALDTNPDHPADVHFKSDDVFLREFLHKREAARKKQEQEDIANGLTPMRAADFVLDKHQLPADKKIVLSGYYWRYEGAEVLTDQPPTRIANDGLPKVGLVTNNTPSDAKGSMQVCQRHPGGWCEITLIGHADTCEYTLNQQPANAEVCLYVDGSRRW